MASWRKQSPASSGKGSDRGHNSLWAAPAITEADIAVLFTRRGLVEEWFLTRNIYNSGRQDLLVTLSALWMVACTFVEPSRGKTTRPQNIAA